MESSASESGEFVPGRLGEDEALVSADGNYVYTLGSDGVLRLTDSRTGATVWTSDTVPEGQLADPTQVGGPFELQLTANGTVLIVSTGSTPSVPIWETAAPASGPPNGTLVLSVKTDASGVPRPTLVDSSTGGVLWQAAPRELGPDVMRAGRVG